MERSDEWHRVFSSGLTYVRYILNLIIQFSTEILCPRVKNELIFFYFWQIVDLILAIMAGILHLSNIDFAQDPELQQLIIVNEEEVDYGTVR